MREISPILQHLQSTIEDKIRHMLLSQDISCLVASQYEFEWDNESIDEYYTNQETQYNSHFTHSAEDKANSNTKSESASGKRSCPSAGYEGLNRKGYKGNRNSRRGVTLGVHITMETTTGCYFSLNSCIYDHKSETIDANVRSICDDIIEQLSNIISITPPPCVDEHSADQLIIFMALATGKSTIICPPVNRNSSLHIESAIKVVTDIMPSCIFHVECLSNGCRSIECDGIGWNA
jgi:hypothetical protein